MTEARKLLSQHAACAMTALRIMPLATAQALRRELGTEAVEVHQAALQSSIGGNLSAAVMEVSLPRRLLTPGIVGPEIACVLALQRKQANCEVVPHPTDASQVMLAPRQVSYTI